MKSHHYTSIRKKLFVSILAAIGLVLSSVQAETYPAPGGVAAAHTPEIAEWNRINNSGDTMAITAEALGTAPSFHFSISPDGTNAKLGRVDYLNGQQAKVVLPTPFAPPTIKSFLFIVIITLFK